MAYLEEWQRRMDQRMQYAIEASVTEEIDGRVVALLVGGPSDGKLLSLPPHTRQWRIAVMPEQYRYFITDGDKVPDLPEHKTITYERDEMLIDKEHPNAVVFVCLG